MPWHAAIATTSLGEDQVVGVTIAGQQIAIYNLGGSFHATGNVCTHAYALMSDGYVEDGCVECPIHAARFDIATGKALCAPASQPLPVFRVRVEGGQVEVFVE